MARQRRRRRGTDRGGPGLPPTQNEIGGASDKESIKRNVISGNGDADNSGYGLFINNAPSNLVIGNYIGTNVEGTAALPNKWYGIAVRGNSANATIGNGGTVEKNVISKPSNLISGNDWGGIWIKDAGTAGTKVQGNFIGVKASGDGDLANSSPGVAVSDTLNISVGGVSAMLGNVISKNTGSGVDVLSSSGVMILGNYIGTKNDGTGNLGNAGWGGRFTTANGNTVTRNTIKNNTLGGISPGTKNRIGANTLSLNAGLGIDRGENGVTLTGLPTITSATRTATTTAVQGSLTSAANTTYTIELFGNTAADPSGYGEGERYLGSVDVTTNGSGYAAFSTTLNAVFGSYVTATATDQGSQPETSELSAAVAVSGGYYPTASVGSRVWIDADGDGAQDQGESGLAGATVYLTRVGGISQSATTNSSGDYLFSNLSPGDYYVRFAAPAGYAYTRAYQGASDVDSNAEVGTGRTETFTLVAYEYNPTIDAGFVAVSGEAGAIAGDAWNDANADGSRGVYEAGLAGVVVRLFAADGTLLATTTTNSYGRYEFVGLAPGGYYIQFEAPPGYVFSPKDNVPGDDTIDSDTGSDGRTDVFTLLTGGQLELDAGLHQ